MSTAGEDFGRVQGRITELVGDGSDPLKIGGHAYLGLPTPTTDGNMKNTWHDLYGRVAVFMNFPPVVADYTSAGPFTKNITTSLSDTIILASPALTQSWIVHNLFCSNLDPTTSITLSLKTNATIRLTGRLRNDGGGFVFPNGQQPWILEGGVALAGVLNTTLSGGVQVNCMAQIVNVVA